MTPQPKFLTELTARVRVEALALLGFLLLKGISLTIRWKDPLRNQPVFDAIKGRPSIVIFWHDRQLMLFPEYKKYRRKLVALASRHSDGRIIARVLEWIGFRTVAGSSSRGGAVALARLIKCVKEGWDVAITPDGPKGPRHVVKEGAVKLAEVTGAPLVPMSYAVEKCWTFKSWDRISLPKPFTRGVAFVGMPIEVPNALSEELTQSTVELVQVELDRITAQSEEYEFR